MNRMIRALTTLGMVLFLALPVSCSDNAPTAPAESEVQASLLGGVLGGVTDLVGETTELLVATVNTLLEPVVCPAERTYSDSEVIGRGGGTLQVGKHRLSIPAGALTQYTRITATAPSGNFAEVRFEPHGLKFERPVTLTLSYESCRLLGRSTPPTIVYTDDKRNILEVFRSEVDPWRKTVSAKTNHFSGYLLAE
jgi:hypothetical protein